MHRGRERGAPLPADVRRAMTHARRRLGWSFNRAARETGISDRHLRGIEHGEWRPSTTVARVLIASYRLAVDTADQLMAGSAEASGRSHPLHGTGFPGRYQNLGRRHIDDVSGRAS